MSRRSLTREDRRLWDRVERTLDKARARPTEPEPPSAPEPQTPPRFVKPGRPVARPAPPPPPPAPPMPPRPVAHAAPHDLEPRRHRRLARERDPIEARIDLHGHGRFEAQDALTAFLMNAHARGYRSVLVVTGKGARNGGVGVIRSSVMDWIAQPPLRAIVAGIASAHRRHGGEGAFYVTLRR